MVLRNWAPRTSRLRQTKGRGLPLVAAMKSSMASRRAALVEKLAPRKALAPLPTAERLMPSSAAVCACLRVSLASSGQHHELHARELTLRSLPVFDERLEGFLFCLREFDVGCGSGHPHLCATSELLK